MSEEPVEHLEDNLSKTNDESSEQVTSLVPSVESRAVSIYEGPKAFIPTSIKWLDPNFDLKVPPENWMRGSSPIEKYILKALHNRRTKKSTHMSSIAMAHSNVGLVDSIDVISDAKNIKRLLEISFAKEEPLSLMIHRVGKTLLIDEFDIHKHLLKKQQDDWKWMRDFYHDQVTNQVSPFPRAQQTQQRLTERNMFSKLLYYSILADEQNEESLAPELVPSQLPESSNKSEQQKCDLQVPDEDEIYFSDDSELGDESDFTQQMEWKFEDIKMMIGTDLPIFSEGSSCVSLRLRDANSPITVLTGLNYWLDNLMCNVPEIAMCYHQNGFVQRYERLSTSEIPHLEGSKFKPEFVKDVAQNILSFLRSNATKIGHTYWLYKERKGDIVKLYDLTSLCDEEQSRQNPFRHPLAHLLFKVALKMHREDNHSKSGIIRALLTNCLALAPEAQPQIAVTAYRILCQLYTREDDSDSATDVLKQHHADDNGDDNSKVLEDKLVDEACTRLDLASLSESRTEARDNKTDHFPPVGGSVEVRCEEALRGLAEGLRLVDDDIDKMVSEVEDGEPLSSVPSVAIPLSYQPLTKEVRSDSIASPESKVRPVKDRLRWVSHSWHRQSKADMLSKVMYCSYTLASCKDALTEYGKALKYIKIALLSYDGLTLLDKEMAKSRSELFYHSIRLCGDVQVKMQNDAFMNIYCKNYKDYMEHEETIVNSALKDIRSESFVRLYTLSTNSEQRLLNALLCYWQCHSQASKQQLGLVLQRLGNCCNELGQFYTRKAKALIMDGADNSKEVDDKYIENLLAEADRHMRDALDHFKFISDKTNIALVNVNMAKTLRLKHIYLSGNSDVYTVQGQVLHQQVIEHYSEAQRILGKKENSPEVWNLVLYEQMECMLEQSFLLEDRAVQGMNTDEVDKQLTSLLLKLLKFYESTGQLHKAAAIHHRLGLRLYKSFRQCSDLQNQKAKRLHNMAESHYDKAVTLLGQLGSASQEVVRIVVDKLNLCQSMVDSCGSAQVKKKHLESGLSLVTSDVTITALSNFSSDGQLTLSDEGMLMGLLHNLIQKVRFITHSLVRLSAHSTSSHRRSKREEFPGGKYKAMYKASLDVDTKETSCEKLREAVTRMCNALAEYQQ